MRVAELKRKIEKEFLDLFPSEQPFIVAKLEDEHGYSLSNNSSVGEFLKHGDRIYAQPEKFGGAARAGDDPEAAADLRGGGNTSDLLEMLRGLQ